jgi:hypothetical protein
MSLQGGSNAARRPAAKGKLRAPKRVGSRPAGSLSVGTYADHFPLNRAGWTGDVLARHVAATGQGVHAQLRGALPLRVHFCAGEDRISPIP